MAGVTSNSPNTSKHRLIYSLETQVNESETSAYEVGEQRERNHRYVTLEPLGNEQKGRSHYISPDVLDAVEGKKAVFSESFLGAQDPVTFSRCPYPGEAEAKTAYVNKTLKRNKMARLFRDGFHDAFVAKRMVMLVEWYDDTTEKSVTLQQPAPLPAIEQQLQQMEVLEVDDSQAHIQTMPGINGPVQVVSGTLKLTVPDGYVKLTLVQPERYFRDPDVAYADEAQWNTIEEDIARGVLVDMGYDRDQVMELAVDYRFRSDEEDAARKRHDSSWTRRRQHNRMDEQESVSFFRTWTWLLIDEDEDPFEGLELGFEPQPGYRLYEIHWSHGEILNWSDGTAAIKELPRHGIFEWCEMKIAHAENGMCTADVMAHNQKTSSTLKRLVLDNQQIANSGRLVALSGGLKNPRDLIENTMGATLWAKRSGVVEQLPPPALSPLTMDTISMLKQDGEERSGLSGLAKGMNTDAVKYQNADNMIERLTTAGQRRVTMHARDFANTFYIEIAQYIVTLAKENDRGQDVVEIGGEMMPIVPAQWQDDEHGMTVAVALTPEEKQAMAQQMLLMHNTILQDPQMALSYGPQQRHYQLDLIYELMGVTDTSKIMLPPNSPEYQQAAMQQQQQMEEEKQKQEQLTGIQVQSTMAQVEALQSSEQRQWDELGWKKTNEMADNLRADEELAWDKDREQQELEIERNQKRAARIGG